MFYTVKKYQLFYIFYLGSVLEGSMGETGIYVSKNVMFDKMNWQGKHDLALTRN